VKPLVFTAQARADLQSILSYSQQKWGVAQSSLYKAKLEKRFQAISANPALGSVAVGLQAGLRRLGAGRHLIWLFSH
jgi:toxin ParE1/3/4